MSHENSGCYHSAEHDNDCSMEEETTNIKNQECQLEIYFILPNLIHCAVYY